MYETRTKRLAGSTMNNAYALSLAPTITKPVIANLPAPVAQPAPKTGLLASVEQAWASLPSWAHYAAISGAAWLGWKYLLKRGR